MREALRSTTARPADLTPAGRRTLRRADGGGPRAVRGAAATTAPGSTTSSPPPGCPRRVLPLLREQGPARPDPRRPGDPHRVDGPRPTSPTRRRPTAPPAHGGPAPLAPALQRHPGRRGGDDPRLGRRRARRTPTFRADSAAAPRLGPAPAWRASCAPRGFGDVDTEAVVMVGAARRVRGSGALGGHGRRRRPHHRAGLLRPLTALPVPGRRPLTSASAERGGQRARGGRGGVERSRALHRHRPRPAGRRGRAAGPAQGTAGAAVAEAGDGPGPSSATSPTRTRAAAAIDEAAAEPGRHRRARLHARHRAPDEAGRHRCRDVAAGVRHQRHRRRARSPRPPSPTSRPPQAAAMYLSSVSASLDPDRGRGSAPTPSARRPSTSWSRPGGPSTPTSASPA